MASEDPHEESIKVCCRFRPQNQLEKEQSGKICITLGDDITSVYVPTIDTSFVYDRVFGSESTQKEVYDYAAKPIINGVLRGFNGTVFAYGQTSSGKTHTMEGPDIEDEVQMGVIPRMVWSIFDGIDHAADYIEFVVKVAIVEIYNERIRDLLDPKKDNLKIHEDKARGVFIGEVTETYVGSEQEIFDMMKVGKYNRSVAETNLNEHSSRSHLIFMMTIEQKNLHDRSLKVGKLHLVDLAGSEKVAKTGASGERLDEAKNINRSLSALGNVINALTDRKSTHVPYRDSKLSRVLQESLGGNAKTSLIITCSPSYFNEQETISTLRFGQRAKMIKNVVKVNHERSVEELKLLLQRRDQIVGDLRHRVSLLEQLLRSNGIPVPEDKGLSLPLPGTASPAPVDEAEKTELEEQLQELRSKLKEKSDEFCEASKEKDDLLSQLQLAQNEQSRLSMEAKNAKEEVENMDYERQEQASELAKLQNEKTALESELEALSKNYTNLFQEKAGTPTNREREREPAMCSRSRAPCLEDKDADRPLKKKVSQLDKNLESLTVMYHKLVAQNSGLKVEVTENDNKIKRKDLRIQQLESNLREAKQKYTKLMTQCANLTAMIDVRGRKNCVCGASGGNSQEEFQLASRQVLEIPLGRPKQPLGVHRSERIAPRLQVRLRLLSRSEGGPSHGQRLRCMIRLRGEGWTHFFVQVTLYRPHILRLIANCDRFFVTAPMGHSIHPVVKLTGNNIASKISAQGGFLCSK